MIRTFVIIAIRTEPITVPTMVPNAAHHGCAADDNRRDDVHFRARANRRLDGREARAVNHTGKAGHHGDEHIGQNLHFIHIDARQSRGFLIAADRQNLSS